MKFEMTEQEFKYYEKIQNYVSGTLTATEKLAFEQEVPQNKELANELDLYKNLIPVIAPNKTGELNLRNTLSEIHSNKSISKTPGKTINLKWYVSLAASLILLMGVIKFVPFGEQGSGMEQYFKYDKIALVSKSVQDPAYGELERAFNAQDYVASNALAKKILAMDSDNADVLLAQGIAQMEIGALDAAIESFNTLKNANLRVDKSDWYLALTYLKMENKKAAILKLEKIIQEQGYKNDLAQRLLTRLKQN